MCPVDFCRDNCKILPEEARVYRADKFFRCIKCNKLVVEHEKFAYPSGMRHIYKSCTGEYLHT